MNKNSPTASNLFLFFFFFGLRIYLPIFLSFSFLLFLPSLIENNVTFVCNMVALARSREFMCHVLQWDSLGVRIIRCFHFCRFVWHTHTLLYTRIQLLSCLFWLGISFTFVITTDFHLFVHIFLFSICFIVVVFCSSKVSLLCVLSNVEKFHSLGYQIIRIG